MTCNLRPPPADAIYIIMVSLVTLLLGIPPSIFVTILLDDYASKWPGKVEGEEEHSKETGKDVADTQLAIISDRRSLKRHKADNPQISYTGNAMKQASIVDAGASSTVTGDAAMYTYCNGKTLEIHFNRRAILRKTALVDCSAQSVRLSIFPYLFSSQWSPGFACTFLTSSSLN